MKKDGKEEAFISLILVVIGIAFLLADWFSAEDLAWKTYAVLTCGCALSFHAVGIFGDKRKKALSAVALAVCQALIIAEFLTGLLAVRISVIVCLILTVAVFVWFFSGIPTKTVCSKEELRRFAERNGVMQYNILSNAGCGVLGVTGAIYYYVDNVVLPSVLICLLILSVTVVRQLYSRKYYKKKPIAYVAELLFIAVGFCAVTLVGWIKEIPESGWGFIFIYMTLLLSAYMIFDRPYVVGTVEAEFGNPDLK